MGEPELNFDGASDALDATDDNLSGRFEEPMPLSEYVDQIYDNPDNSGHKQRTAYLLDAIENQGKRTVVEKGEEKERWEFFDDPANNGEHAIIGNTEELNNWVQDLRKRVRPDSSGEAEIDWFDGPTATGKSELRKNIISGLKEHSRTDEGRIYTVEWNKNPGKEGTRKGLGHEGQNFEADYLESPTIQEPLQLFPEDIQDQIEADLNKLVEDMDIQIKGSLLPPNRKNRETLWEEARGEDQDFAERLDEDYVRVKNVELGEGPEGKGIRTITAEQSDKSIEQLLLGNWLARWSQDGQWPGSDYDGITAFNFIEEGDLFLSKIPQLKNFIDDDKISGFVDVHMDNYTMIISNQDGLEPLERSNVDEDSVKRRTNRFRFNYLTNFRQETGLLRKELSPRDLDFNPAIAEDVKNIRAPLEREIEHEGEEIEVEYAPHTLESASMYAILSRLTDDTPKPDAELDDELSLLEKAELFESGEITRKDSDNQEITIDMDDLEFEALEEEGSEGIPVTYVRDVMSDLTYDNECRELEEYDLDLGKVVLPTEAIDALQDQLDESSLLEDKADKYRGDRLEEAREYALDQMEEDVLEAVFMNYQPGSDDAKSYLNHLFADIDDEKVQSETGRMVDPDPRRMKEFETRYLGFDEDNYDGKAASSEVEDFRSSINNKLSKRIRESDIDPEEIEAKIKDNPLELEPISDEISHSDYSWEDIKDIKGGTEFDNFNPQKWDEYHDPLSFEDQEYDTDTERVKYQALSNMVEEMDYSRESAVKTAETVIDERALSN